MGVIAVINVHPAIDRIYKVTDFSAGDIVRAKNSIQVPAGKGFNSIKCLDWINKEAKIYSFIPAIDHDLFSKVQSKTIETRFCAVDGSSRVNVTISSEGGEMLGHIQDEGMEIDPEKIAQLHALIEADFAECHTFIVSGSIPKTFDDDFYFDLIRFLKENKRKVIFDSSGSMLRKGISAIPDLVKPNLTEFEDLVQKKLGSIVTIAKEMKKLNDKGIGHIVVSLGKNGALISERDSNYVIKATVDLKYSKPMFNDIGCGDSMIAGIGVSIDHNETTEMMITRGMACGTANLFKEGPGNIDLDVYELVLNKVKLEKIAL